MRLALLTFAFATLFWMGCDDDECPTLIDSICFSFDVRQCQTDLFADDVPEDSPKSERESLMKDWFVEQGVDVEALELEIGYHEAVCEACDVCPMGDRYFVQAFVSPGIDMDSLRLLNFKSEDCCEVFD